MESTLPSVTQPSGKNQDQTSSSILSTPTGIDNKAKADHEITKDDGNLNAVIEDEEDDFDPFKKADFNEAVNHRQAKLVHRLDGQDLSKCKRCPCCGLPIDASEFKALDPIIDLKELGPGFPQYFYLVKYVGAILIMCMTIAGMACWIDNLVADRADEWANDSGNFATKSAVGSQGDKDKIMPFWHSVLHVVVMILMLISYFWLRGYLRRKDEDIDVFITTPSDYTIWVRNLPLDVKEDEIKEFFSKNTMPGTTVEIIKVNFPYDIREFVEVTRERNAIKEKLGVIKEFKRENPGVTEFPKTTYFFCLKRQMESEESLRKKKAVYTERLQKYNNDIAPGVGRDLQIGQAFVTFKNQGDARIAAEKFSQNFIYRLLARMFGCFRRKKQGSLTFKKRVLRATMAPEPTDILWENLSVTFMENFKKQLVTFFVSFLALGASFGMVYGCSDYQEQIYRDYEDESEDERSQSDEWKVRINSIWPSIIIVIINFLLGRAIRYFSSFEKHHTFTYYNTSVGIKLTAAQCINTALITIIVNLDWRDTWFSPGGLVVDMTYVLISNAVVAPLLYIFSPVYILKRLNQRRAIKNPLLLQGEANLLWEEPQVDMAQRYANTMKTLIVTLSYAPIIPLGVLISIVAIFLQYWVDKLLLIKRHSRPARLSGALSEAMIRMIPFGILIYAIMNYVFMWKLNSDDSYVAFVWMWIVVSYFVFPIDLIFSCRRKRDISVFQHNQEDFENASVDFVDDYDRCNPVTSEKAYDAYLDFLVKKNLIDADQVNEMLPTQEAQPEQPTNGLAPNKPAVGSLAGSINMYASNRVSLQSYEQSTFGAAAYKNPKKTNKKVDPNAVKPHKKPQNSNISHARKLVQNAKKNVNRPHVGYHDVGHVSNHNPYASALVQYRVPNNVRPSPNPNVYPAPAQQAFNAPYSNPQVYPPQYVNNQQYATPYVASQPNPAYMAQPNPPYMAQPNPPYMAQPNPPYMAQPNPNVQNVAGFQGYPSYPGEVQYSDRFVAVPQPTMNQGRPGVPNNYYGPR